MNDNGIMNSKLLIIGNGFDIDLGRNISFNDFFASSFWPKNKNCTLKAFIEMWGATDNWFDLEHYIDLYCDSKNNFIPQDVINDLHFFNVLKSRLAKYIDSKSNNLVRCIKRAKGKCQRPVSYQILREIIKKGGWNVYSFNYTQLNNLWAKMTEDPVLKSNPSKFAEFDCYMHYVHGSLRDNDMALGASGAMPDVRDGYSYMKKSNMIAIPSHIKDALEISETVIIFGHSLSSVDYCYFKDFFDSLKQGRSICKKLIIITRSIQSMNAIKDNLLSIDKSNFLLFDKMEYYFTDTISSRLRSYNKSHQLDTLLSYID